MKNFIKELGKTIVTTVVVVPFSMAAICSGMMIYSELVEPILKKIFRIDTNIEKKES